MIFLKKQPIRRQVAMSVALAVLPLAVAVLWSASRALTEREDELRSEAKSLATTSAAYLNRYLDGIDSLASALARHPDVRALRESECNHLFQDVLQEQPLLVNIIVTDALGIVHGSALPAPGRVTTVTLPYVAQVVGSGRPVVSDLTTGRVSGKQTIILAYPVFRDDRVVAGVLGFGVDLAQLQTIFNSMHLPEGSVVTLTDRASRVLARSLDPERFIGTTITQTPYEPKHAPDTLVMTGVDGITRIFGNAVVERGPWLLSVGIPQSLAAARIRPLWRRDVAIIGVGIAATLLLAMWLAQRLAGQLNRLRSAAQRIAGGDLGPPARGDVANLELAELQDTFIVMANNLREMRDALDHQVEEERKMHEALQSLQRQVVRQERLAAVGVLVSGVAHELNNPLQGILGTAELLEHHKGLSTEILDEIAFVKVQAGRAREIIRNLSRFSSQQSGPPSLVSLRDVISEVVQLRQRDLENAGISLEVQSSSSRMVQANFTELEQVTLNFVINAQQSIEASGRPKGKIVVRLYDDRRNICLEVSDNGLGVSPDDEPKLFQPFFTTKPVGKGTGLGLSVSYGIIDSYGGSIGYRSNEWGGAVFFFELPASDASEAARHDEHDRQALLHRSVSPRL